MERFSPMFLARFSADVPALGQRLQAKNSSAWVAKASSLVKTLTNSTGLGRHTRVRSFMPGQRVFTLEDFWTEAAGISILITVQFFMGG